MSPPRHTREQRLLAQIRKLRAAVDTVPDAVLLLDHDHRIRWANPAARRLLGIDRRRDHGASALTLLGDSELSRWLGDHPTDVSEEVPAPNDNERRLGVTLMPFGDDQNVLLARDISHLSRLEKVRRDFVANVSHELRTPLTVIHGYLELFDPADMPEMAPALEEMRAQSQRMGRIVEDLLTLSRLETQAHLDEERVDMTSLLDSLAKEARALSKGRHEVVIRVDAETDLRGSTQDLHSAFSNLVSNAVRYTPDGGRIVIAWQRCHGGASYSVSDTGYGIPAKHLARLSERFYRVSSSRSRAKGGTGLGLSIVKHVLNLHQARLQIESEPDKGSTFSCVFDRSRLLAADKPCSGGVS